MLTVLRQRNFALLWIGGLISMLGDWILITAIPFYLYEQTGSALAVGGLLMASLFPSFLLGSIAGVFVDRWNRQRTMVLADAGRAGLLLGLFVILQQGDHYWSLYVVTALQAALSSFFGPAENALLPTLVDRENLVAANSLNVLNNNLARLIGPVIGGVVFSLTGIHGVILVDGASFLVSGALIFMMQTRSASTVADQQHDSPASKIWTDWKAGLRIVQGDRLVAWVFVICGLAMFADSMNSTLLVPFMDDVLQGGAQGFGWLLAIQAIGGIVGSAIVGRMGAALAPGRMLGMSMIAVGAMSLILAIFPSLALALVFSALGGLPAVGYLVGSQTLLQDAVPDRLRGRVFGAWDTTSAFLRFLAIAGTGTLADVAGIIPLMYCMAILRLLSGVAAVLILVPSHNRLGNTADADQKIA